MKPLERLGLFFILIILVVSTLSTVIASRGAERAAKNTDLIKECTTPGTKCFELQRQSEARRSAENKCIIESVIDLPSVGAERINRRGEILAGYDACVEEFVLSNISTTTTTAKLPE